MTSGMTLSSISPVRNPQCPPSIPLLDPPPLPDTLPIDISTRNFQLIQNNSHMVPNDSQMVLNDSQLFKYDSKMVPNGQKWLLHGPKWFQNGSKWLPINTKKFSNGPKWFPNSLIWVKIVPNDSKLSKMTPKFFLNNSLMALPDSQSVPYDYKQIPNDS